MNWKLFHNLRPILDEATRKQLERGQRLMEVLKQKQYSPLCVAEIAFSWFAAEKGYLDDVELKKVRSFNESLAQLPARSISRFIG